MKTILINSYRFNLKYAHELLEGVDENMMTHSPSDGLENHPAFTIGHLVSAAAMTSRYLGGSYEIEKAWEDLFKRTGPGDSRLPNPNATLYPSKATLLSELTRQHQLVEELEQALNLDEFRKPAKWRFRESMPTLGDLLYFMCITHESMNLGQLAAWRRAIGLSSALAAI